MSADQTIFPEQDLSVAVLCNVATNATQLGHAVADVYLPQHGSERVAAAPGAPTGLYRSQRDHSVIAIQDGSAGRANVRQELEAGGRLCLVSEMDRVCYEKVERANPTRAELETMTGDYVSDEAEVTLTVTVEGDRLVIHRRPDARFTIAPTYKDGFSSPLGSVRFLRDGSGKITEMSIGESRVWDLRLRRMR